MQRAKQTKMYQFIALYKQVTRIKKIIVYILWVRKVSPLYKLNFNADLKGFLKF